MGRKVKLIKKGLNKLATWGAVGYAGYEVGQNNEGKPIVFTPTIKVEKDEVEFKDLMIVLVAVAVLFVIFLLIKELSKCVQFKFTGRAHENQPEPDQRHQQVNA